MTPHALAVEAALTIDGTTFVVGEDSLSKAAAIIDATCRVTDREQLLAECRDVLKVCLDRLIRLDAEAESETIGPCPACEQVRSLLARMEGR